jgi:hypothetical protein
VPGLDLRDGHGVVDEQLLITARDRGVSLRLLSLRGGRNPVYMKHVAGLFGSSRLKNLAQVGLLPMLTEWFETDPRVASSVAVLQEPDLWAGAGFTAIPAGLVFYGVSNPDKATLLNAMREQERFCTQFLPEARATAAAGGPMAGFARDVLRRLALMDNNLGVLLEDAGCRDEAFRLYLQAREINDGNLSALLNLAAMLKSGFTSPREEIGRASCRERVYVQV